MVGFGQQSIFLLLSGFSSCGYALASLVASAMYEAAKVKFQTRHRPDFHGEMEQPSGRLPSDLYQDAKLHTPEMFPFIYSCYSASYSLYFHDTIISSAEGVQQGDPLGPLLFCLVIFPSTQMLRSEFRIFYLDDATLGGNEADVCDDFKMIEREAADIGLELNHHKSELICADQAARSFAPGT